MDNVRLKKETLSMNKLGNPGPLGLLGFGMTTILLNLHNAGLLPLSIVIIAMGVALGGFAQIIAGILEFKNGNTFGGTAYTAYGFFWLSLVIIWTEGANYGGIDLTSMGYYLLLWGIFTLFMFIGSLKHNRLTQAVFFSLTILFILLAVADFTAIGWIKVIAGIIGIICGMLAMYSAVAQIVNLEHKKEILPIK